MFKAFQNAIAITITTLVVANVYLYADSKAYREGIDKNITDGIEKAVEKAYKNGFEQGGQIGFQRGLQQCPQPRRQSSETVMFEDSTA